MSKLASSLRKLAQAAIALGLIVAQPAQGQQREALIWTGHLDLVFKVVLADFVRRATQAWQKSRNHAATGRLTTGQTGELIQQALTERDAV